METTYKLTRVRNMNTLKAMQRAGLIKLHKDTGTKINGRTIYYIDDLTEGTPYTFYFKNKPYMLKYLSGCFCPFVYRKVTEENN